METEQAYMNRVQAQKIPYHDLSGTGAEQTLMQNARDALYCANRIGSLIEDLDERLFTSGQTLREVSKGDTSVPPEPLITTIRGTRQRLESLESALRSILERL